MNQETLRQQDQEPQSQFENKAQELNNWVEKKADQVGIEAFKLLHAQRQAEFRLETKRSLLRGLQNEKDSNPDELALAESQQRIAENVVALHASNYDLREFDPGFTEAHKHVGIIYEEMISAQEEDNGLDGDPSHEQMREFERNSLNAFAKAGQVLK